MQVHWLNSRLGACAMMHYEDTTSPAQTLSRRLADRTTHALVANLNTYYR